MQTLQDFGLFPHNTENPKSILKVKNAKAVVCRCSVQKDIFRNFAKNLQENTCARDSFLIKLQALGSLLRISDTGVFLWILWNIQEYLFYRTPPVAATESLKVMSLFRIFTLLLQIPCISFDKHASSAGNESLYLTLWTWLYFAYSVAFLGVYFS